MRRKKWLEPTWWHFHGMVVKVLTTPWTLLNKHTRSGAPGFIANGHAFDGWHIELWWCSRWPWCCFCGLDRGVSIRFCADLVALWLFAFVLSFWENLSFGVCLLVRKMKKSTRIWHFESFVSVVFVLLGRMKALASIWLLGSISHELQREKERGGRHCLILNTNDNR